MTMQDIYESMKARGLVRSHREFSRQFLGRAANYASDTGLDRCSIRALLCLYARLGEIKEAALQAAAFERLLAAEERYGHVAAVQS
jgi:hypothetical protein